MSKCSFCGVDIKPGTGKMFVFNSGKIDYFCSRTCEKQLLILKRKPLSTKWTEEYRKENRKTDNKKTGSKEE